MKKLKLLVFLFMILSFLTFNIKALEDNYIEEYKINLNVQENGSIDIKQNIRVNFTRLSHGIYATIPQTYKIRWDENTTKEYFFPVSNIEVLNHEYEVISSTEGVIIKIGDPDVKIDGIVNYEYSYTIQTKNLDYKNMQMLYFDLVGSDWQMDIKKTLFTINMPKEFKESPMFYPPNESDLQYLNYNVENKKISGSYTSTLGNNKALTVLINLDNNYFAFPTNTMASIIFTGLFGLFSIIIVGLFFRHGKDSPVIKTVEFNPPEGMSSAEVGYVVDGSIQGKDITSLIVYWASKGYLKIKDLDNKDFELIKAKDISTNEMAFEQTLFNELFKNNDVVDKKSIPNDFVKLVISNNSSDYAHRYSKDKAIFVSFSTKLKWLLFVIMSSLNAIMVYYFTNKYFGMFFQNMLYSAIALALSFTLGILINNALTNRAARLKGKNLMRTLIMIVFSIIFVISYLFILVSVDVDIVIIIISIVLTFINYIFIAFMSKRTEQGNLWLGQILGFKDFMLYAEKERLEMLVNDNPQYFYNTLPYAYVLGVSSKWIDKFEDIKLEQPDWYISNYPLSNLIFMTSINNTLNNFNSQLYQINADNIAGSGGFSGGGGGFSGGGFGGGGGGSW